MGLELPPLFGPEPMLLGVGNPFSIMFGVTPGLIAALTVANAGAVLSRSRERSPCGRERPGSVYPRPLWSRSFNQARYAA